MKRLITGLLAVAVVFSQGVTDAFAQDASSEYITIRKTDVPAEMLSRLKEKEYVQQVGDRVKQYGEWVGIGKEIGIAVNEGLEAVTDKASKFSETLPGKVTIAVIIWKVVGKDILGLLVGIPLIILATSMYAWAWRSLFRGAYIFAGLDEHGKKKYEYKECVFEGADSKDGILVLGGITTLIYLLAVVIVVGVMIL